MFKHWKLFAFSLISGLAIDLCCQLIYKVYFGENQSTKKKNKRDVDKVLIFPDLSLSHMLTDKHWNQDQRKDKASKTEISPMCRGSGPFRELCEILESAVKNLDICMYIITCPAITDLLIKLHKKRISIRIVTEEEHGSVMYNSQIGNLRAAGIPVRFRKKSSFIMHHKFVIIDGKLLMNGSYNWSQSGFAGNNENVIITSNKDLVLPFKSEFMKLWSEFLPTNNST